MKLSGHSILIVESGVGSFVVALQAAIDRTGAESMVARDVAAALQRTPLFAFSAAVINVEHRALIDNLDIPVVVYGASALPARPEIIVSRLKKLLGEARQL